MHGPQGITIITPTIFLNFASATKEIEHTVFTIVSYVFYVTLSIPY